MGSCPISRSWAGPAVAGAPVLDEDVERVGRPRRPLLSAPRRWPWCRMSNTVTARRGHLLSHPTGERGSAFAVDVTIEPVADASWGGIPGQPGPSKRSWCQRGLTASAEHGCAPPQRVSASRAILRNNRRPPGAPRTRRFLLRFLPRSRDAQARSAEIAHRQTEGPRSARNVLAAEPGTMPHRDPGPARRPPAEAARTCGGHRSRWAVGERVKIMRPPAGSHGKPRSPATSAMERACRGPPTMGKQTSVWASRPLAGWARSPPWSHTGASSRAPSRTATRCLYSDQIQ